MAQLRGLVAKAASYAAVGAILSSTLQHYWQMLLYLTSFSYSWVAGAFVVRGFYSDIPYYRL